MFRSVSLTDFQSHRNTHLPLGPFTVIVGSSSSGKSAVVRALRLVAENARGTTYVRQGAKSTKVALELSGSEPVLDASTVVEVERGKGISSYTLRVAGMHNDPMVFTKCASGVPDAVSAALELGETKLWIAGQFDRPYLLDETGAEVARVLGKLTNVNMIYAAVRESNRRAAEARRFHSSRASDLAEARGGIKRYITLPQRLAAGREAEAALERSEVLLERRARLVDRVAGAVEASDRSRVARVSVRAVPDVSRLSALAAARSRLAETLYDARVVRSRRVSVTVGLRPVPDTQKLVPLLARRASLREALQRLSQVAALRGRLGAQVMGTRAEADAARTRFSAALRSAGSCPLCGASAAHAQVDNVV